jgi:hypothetical protein
MSIAGFTAIAIGVPGNRNRAFDGLARTVDHRDRALAANRPVPSDVNEVRRRVDRDAEGPGGQDHAGDRVAAWASATATVPGANTSAAAAADATARATGFMEHSDVIPRKMWQTFPMTEAGWQANRPWSWRRATRVRANDIRQRIRAHLAAPARAFRDHIEAPGPPHTRIRVPDVPVALKGQLRDSQEQTVPARTGPERGRAMLSKAERSDLLDMTWHWETAYRFEVTDGTWRPVPLTDPTGVLTADTASDLREMVRRDYGKRQASLHPVRGECMST